MSRASRWRTSPASMSGARMSTGYDPSVLAKPAGVTQPRTRSACSTSVSSTGGCVDVSERCGVEAPPRAGRGSVEVERDLVDLHPPAGEQGLGDPEAGHRHAER